MTRDEFSSELGRLVSGFQHQNRMTEEREAACYERWGRVVTVAEWRQAVSRLLTGSHYPNDSQIDQAVAEASGRGAANERGGWSSGEKARHLAGWTREEGEAAREAIDLSRERR